MYIVPVAGKTSDPEICWQQFCVLKMDLGKGQGSVALGFLNLVLEVLDSNVGDKVQIYAAGRTGQ